MRTPCATHICIICSRTRIVRLPTPTCRLHAAPARRLLHTVTKFPHPTFAVIRHIMFSPAHFESNSKQHQRKRVVELWKQLPTGKKIFYLDHDAAATRYFLNEGIPKYSLTAVNINKSQCSMVSELGVVTICAEMNTLTSFDDIGILWFDGTQTEFPLATVLAAKANGCVHIIVVLSCRAVKGGPCMQVHDINSRLKSLGCCAINGGYYQSHSPAYMAWGEGTVSRPLTPPSILKRKFTGAATKVEKAGARIFMPISELKSPLQGSFKTPNASHYSSSRPTAIDDDIGIAEVLYKDFMLDPCKDNDAMCALNPIRRKLNMPSGRVRGRATSSYFKHRCVIELLFADGKYRPCRWIPTPTALFKVVDFIASNNRPVSNM